jgi:hypothetical protein
MSAYGEMSADEEQELAELTKRAEEDGFRVIRDHTWGLVLWRIGKPTTNPHTHSNANLADLREMIEAIEWGIEHGTVKLD